MILPWLARLIHAIWLGGGLFLMFVAAPAAFRASPNSTAAAEVVGTMLARWHYLALIAPLALLVLEWRRARMSMMVILFVALLLAAGQAIVDARIRSIRVGSAVPISALSREDAVRKNFGRLHGLSSLLMLAQIACAAGALRIEN